MQTVAVIDYGMSNLHSVAKAVAFAAAQNGGTSRVQVTSDAALIRQADKVVFPGQGAMGQCVAHLNTGGLIPVLREVMVQKPFLGICLGLQSLFDRTEEDGGTAGLGLVAGRVVRFPQALSAADGARLKVPHVGWNQVAQSRPHPLWQAIPPESYFYFVHSYYVVPEDSAKIAGCTDYGGEFASAVAYDNVFATQFHPEKSQRAGIQLLQNFLNWDGGIS